MPPERDITERIRLLSRKHSEIILGIGDDCAIVRPPGSKKDLVITTDLSIEGVHFHADASPAAAGAKALARGLSDIAAMGANPEYCFISLAAANKRIIDHFYRGLLSWDVPVAGGDLSRTDKIICDVTLVGSVPRDKALRRDGAKPGDGIYVSGPLGGFAARGYRIPPVPQPRVRFGLGLRGRASACIDLSDGLSRDLHRLCLASGVAAKLDEIPVAQGASLHDALHGGEDYELLFTAGKAVKGAVRIGAIVAGNVGAVSYRDKLLKPRAYDHFPRR